MGDHMYMIESESTKSMNNIQKVTFHKLMNLAIVTSAGRHGLVCVDALVCGRLCVYINAHMNFVYVYVRQYVCVCVCVRERVRRVGGV